MRPRLLPPQAVLFFVAAAALSVVVIRACVQSITLDEAASFLGFAVTPWPAHWWPSSDNHVLNSMLMRLSATVFGTNNLSARLPAILGAAIYIGSALYLCSKLIDRALLRVLLLICLVYNPMILDYLVAARGYSLAIACLLAAIAVVAGAMVAREAEPAVRVQRNAACLSVLLALSCAANFSFAIANGTLLAAFFVWSASRARFALRESIRLALATFTPGLLVGFLLCGSVVLSWPRSELYFGSKSMAEMWSGFAAGSFDELNPYLVNPLLMPWLDPLRAVLPYAAAAAALLLFGCVEFRRWRKAESSPPLHDFIRILALVSATALLLHWLAFRLAHIPLPRDRTGLFFMPIWTLIFVCSIASLSAHKARTVVRWPAIAVLSVAALYFLGSLRLGYFREWKFDADTKTLYWIVDNLHRRCGIGKFSIDWRYQMALNFYRREYGSGSLPEFTYSTSGEIPPDRDAYVMFLPTSGEFVEQQRLKVIYRNDESGSAVAIRSCPAQPPAN